MRIHFYYIFLAIIFFTLAPFNSAIPAFLLIWTGVALTIISSAYIFKKPTVFRKQSDGSIPFFISILLLPFILGVQLYNIIAIRLDKTDRVHHIKDGVYVGRRLNAGDLLTLENLNIKAVMDMTAEFSALDWSTSVMDLDYLNIPILDHQSPDLNELRQAITWIDNQVELKRPVVVHCALGRGRSVFVVAAYLLAKSPELSVREVLESITKIRHFANLNQAQLKCLVEYHRNNQIKIHDKACLIANPVSGGGKWEDSKNDIIQQLFKSFKLSVEETTIKRSATEIAKQAIENNTQTIIAAGGDGTLREVAQQLVNTDIQCGVIPLGTTNALSHHLYGNISKLDPVGVTLAHITSKRCEKIDTATCNQKTVLLLVGIGLEHEMINYADRETKNDSGQFAYLEGFFRGFAEGKKHTLHVEFDQQAEQEIPCTSFVVANAAPFTSLLAQGNGAPDIKDGLLDVTWLKPSSKVTSKLIDFVELITASVNFRQGSEKHDTDSNIQVALAKKINIKSDQKISYVIDGEVFEDDVVCIESNPQSLNIFKDKSQL